MAHKKKTIQGQENPSTNISNSNLLKITQKKHVEKSVSKQSHYFVTSGRQRGTWEIWADVKGGGSSSPAEKLDHFLKLISPVYYQSKRASLWNTAAGQEIYLSSICERLAVERLQLRILFTHDIPGG